MYTNGKIPKQFAKVLRDHEYIINILASHVDPTPVLDRDDIKQELTIAMWKATKTCKLPVAFSGWVWRNCQHRALHLRRFGLREVQRHHSLAAMMGYQPADIRARKMVALEEWQRLYREAHKDETSAYNARYYQKHKAKTK